MSARSDDKMGPSSASLNAKLAPEPRRTGRATGAAGRDAGEGAGIESGLCHKEPFVETAVEQLGKPIEPMGTPPWSSDVRQIPADQSPTDTFGAGESHTIKNG
jgi:hypothetical protein